MDKKFGGIFAGVNVLPKKFGGIFAGVNVLPKKFGDIFAAAKVLSKKFSSIFATAKVLPKKFDTFFAMVYSSAGFPGGVLQIETGTFYYKSVIPAQANFYVIPAEAGTAKPSLKAIPLLRSLYV